MKTRPECKVTCPYCEKIAFYLIDMPEPTDRVEATNFVLLDGTTPDPIDYIECGSCGEHLTMDMSMIKYLNKNEKLSY